MIGQPKERSLLVMVNSFGVDNWAAVTAIIASNEVCLLFRIFRNTPVVHPRAEPSVKQTMFDQFFKEKVFPR